jgi:dipeptidase D
MPVPEGMFYIKVDINALTGGHSGDDIDKGRANANKLLARFLCRVAEKYDFYLCDISGGSLHNAIPRDASAVFAIPAHDKEAVRVDFNVFAAEVQNEYSVTEPTARFLLQSTDPVGRCIEPAVAMGLLKSLNAVFNGVFAMSQDMPGLVDTSSNLASVKRTSEDVITVITSQRSSIESARGAVCDVVRAAFELGGAVVECNDGYPGWKPNVKSEILKVACDTYKDIFGGEAKIRAIHAGLECGLFLEKAPGLDMISFGPTLRDVHSPDERMHIPAVEKFWLHLLRILEKVGQIKK